MLGKKVFYGWYIVAASLILIILDGLLLYSFGVFFPYLNEEFGLSRAAGSSIFSLRSFVLAFSLTLAGRLVDKYDPRAVVFGGGIFCVLGVFLSGLATKGWHLYVTYGVIIGLGDGVLYITCVALVSRWFIKKRTLAIGIITTGIPLSGLITNPLTAWLIKSFGVRNAFFALAGIILISILSALVLRAYPEDKGLKPYGEDEQEKSSVEPNQKGSQNNNDWKALEAIATPTFWLLYVMYFFAFITFLVVVVHLFNFAIDLGIPPLVASGAPAAIGLGSLCGRLILSALLTEVLEKRKVLFICFLLQGSSIFLLLFIRETWAFYLFGILFGFFYSGTVPIFPTLLGNFFGLRALGTIYGFFGSSYSVAAICGPLAAGYIHDATGSYFYPFLLAIFFCYVAAFSSFFIKTPQKIKKEIVSASS
ncbi:MAG: MFS transporter [Deltaproteobacteria bacterium]|nr:MFS transporter [Deltaproteobacteria bacterium]